jgi:glutamate-1-semialdehyde aminotransferase
MPNSVQFNEGYPCINRSDEYYARAAGLIPAATQTLAKGPGQYVRGIAPKYLKSGKGCHVWDVDGNEYIDLVMGVGPVSLGYQYPVVDDAIREQLGCGISFSLMHPLEVEVAELVRESVQSAEMVRFSKTGCDVTSAAVRLARAYTNRERILCCGYHGWHDWYIGVTERIDGVPVAVRNLTGTFQYNNLDSLVDAIDERTACVILEPVAFTLPEPGFLARLREICDENGALLVFDEMWTGFRLAIGGAQEHFGVRADLACYSKAIANGMPLSVLAGRCDVMELCEKDIFFFTTFGGEALSLAAAKATIVELRDKAVPDFLARQGEKLRTGYNAIASELNMPYTTCSGLDCRTVIGFDPAAGNPLELKSLLQQEMIKRGVLWAGSHNLSYSHSDADIAHILRAYKDALPIVKDAVDAGNVISRLRGAPVEPIFTRSAVGDTGRATKAADGGGSH